jgi:hypothetical protein
MINVQSLDKASSYSRRTETDVNLVETRHIIRVPEDSTHELRAAYIEVPFLGSAGQACAPKTVRYI